MSAVPAFTPTRAALFAADSREGLAADLASGRERRVGGSVRLAVLDPTPERIARAKDIAARGKPWRGRDGIWFTPAGLLAEGGSLAFVFPGVDASFEPRVDDVAEHFGLEAPRRVDARDLTQTGLGIVGVNRLLDRVLRGLGYVPAHVAGHSIGEWSGMISTGVIPTPALEAFIASLEPSTLKVPGVVFAAAGCGREKALAAMAGLESIALSHDNCPHQVLICGAEASVDAALARLREDGVLVQRLPFQSGFHSPLFADYIGPHRENFARLPLEAPRATLWSATLCEPYPREPDAIRALSIEHLVKPVRFRELVERLYAEGARVFVQVGTGSVAHFVEDTLKGRPHLSIAANVKERTGMEQLRRLLAALFVEGAHAPSELLGLGPAPAPALAPAPAHPLAADFADLMAAVAEAQRSVLAALTASQPARPVERTTTRTLSLETMPELADHAFVRQPDGWPVASDRQPVVPMTTSVELMIEHALELTPGRVAVAVEDVRAYRWLVVAPPVELQVVCRFDGRDRVHVKLGDYGEGTVVVAAVYSPPPPADVAPLADGATAMLDARRVYTERTLFHGPAYQGIVDLGIVGSDGIRGTLECGAARGALLDNAGQLYGWWVVSRHATNRMAMPVRIGRIALHGPHPRPGDRLECTVRIRSIDEKSAVADLSLARDGRVWAAIEGWEDRRLETDARLWPVMLWPEKNVLSDPHAEGFVVFEDRYRAANTRDRLARRYLGERERQEYESQPPRRQRAWLSGRVAAKDAVRSLLWSVGHAPLFPVEVTIANEASGRPVVRAAGGRDVRVSIAHKDEVAVAMAADGRDVGIDVERVEARGDSFAEMAFTAAELRLVDGEPGDEAWTRMWAAKEAAAKAAGTGLGGAPHRFPVRDRAGSRLLVGDRWVDTKRHGDFVIAWTGE